MKRIGKKAECLVSPHLALMLRVSRVAGIAPLQLKRERDGWIIRVSPAINVYGYLFVTAMNMCTIIAVAFDLSVPIENSVRMHSQIRCMVWISDVIIVSVISSVGAYAAPAQMRRMVTYVNQIQKIKSDLKMYAEPYSKGGQYGLLVALVITTAIFTIDFALIMNTTLEEGRSVFIAIMYSSYYCSYMIMQLLELQFILVASHVLSGFKLINSCLKAFVLENGYQDDNDTPSIIEVGNRVHPHTTFHAKSVNKVIDCLAISHKNKTDSISSPLSRNSQQIIRRLALSYASVCDVVRHVNETNGIMLMLLLTSFLLHLIITPYYLIMSLLHDPAKSLWEKYSHPVFQLIWCAFHLTDLIMIIEPCHRTHTEMDLTKELVGRLLCLMTSRHDPVYEELESFFKRLTLMHVAYSPLKICTLTRSLVATILGSVTTYLAVIVQL